MRIIASIIVFVLSSCIQVAEAERERTHHHPFNVGVVVPLTGELAEYGVAIRNGIDLARRDHPDRFTSVNFAYEDSRYDGKVAVSALQKFMSQGTIDLYYLWGVSPTEAMLPIASAKKLAVLAETTVKEATLNKPFVVRAARTGERIAKALASEIKRRGAKSVSLVTCEIPFYVDIKNHLERLLAVEGISVLTTKEVLPSESDFRSLLLEKSLKEADLVGVFLLPSQLVTFFKQSNQAKLSLKMFNADILDSQAIVAESPNSIDGTFFTQVGVSAEFRERYVKLFGGDSQIGSAAQAYDMALIVGDLFDGGTERYSSSEIIGKIAAMSPRTGATGAFHYSESEEAGKEIRMPVSMKMVRGGRIETLNADTGF